MAEILLGNIKGEKGADGTSAVITDVSATVDNTIGTPSVTVTMGGTESKRSFLFAFSGLKGEKGDTGNTGEQGEPGTSVVGEDDIHINEEIPIYEEATTLAPLSSGEKISIAFGKIKKAVGELIAHLINHENPHNVTASQVGLGNVDNTSDLDKPISKATSEAISGANSLIAKVQDNLNTHSNDSTHITYAERTAWNSKAEGTHSHDDKYYTEEEVDSKLSGKAPTSHTHSKGEITDFPTSLPASDVPNWAKQSTKPSYTASEVGLGNVPNVATNDQTPTYTEASSLTTLTSGEKMSVAFGKIKKAITDLISHIADTTKHITSTERTTWNGKAPQSHASTATTYGVGTSSNYGHLKITDAIDSTATDTAASAKALKTVYDSISGTSMKLIKTQTVSNVTLTQGTKHSVAFTDFDLRGYDLIVAEFNGTIKITCPSKQTGQLYIYPMNASPNASLYHILCDTTLYTSSKTDTINVSGVRAIYKRNYYQRYKWGCAADGTASISEQSEYVPLFYLVDVGIDYKTMSAYGVTADENIGMDFNVASASSFTGSFVINGTIKIYGKEVENLG